MTQIIPQLRTTEFIRQSSVSGGIIAGIFFCLSFWLFLLFLCVKASHADNRVTGQDHLAGQQANYRSGYAGKYLPSDSAIGALDYSFGTDVAPIRNLLRYEAPLYFRVHILNTVCVRNKNCGAYEILSGYTVNSANTAITAREQKILKPFGVRVKLYCDLQKEFPHTIFIISHSLEHNLTKPSVRVLIDEILRICPDVMVSNNPEFPWQGERYKGALMEGHGDMPGDVEISSLDGKDGTDIDINAWLKRTSKHLITFFWSRGYNCRNQGPWQDPRARKSCNNPDLLEGFAHIMDDKGPLPKPQFSCQFKPFKAPNIWKPLSEDNGSGDPRANLPVLIMPGTKSDVAVLARNGKVLGKLGYYGPFQGTQNRYYSGQFGSNLSGWAFEKKAVKEGSNYVWLKQGRTCYGPIISSRRQGSFR